MSYTDNPTTDFETFDCEQEERKKQLPHCEICGEPIFDDLAFCIDGDWYHTGCYEDEFLKMVV